MYWNRTGSILDPLIFIILSLGWIIGGWLLVRRSGRFSKREQLVAGMASGLLLYIMLGNAVAHFLPLYFAFALTSILILLFGVWVSRNFKFAWPELIAPSVYFPIAAMMVMTGLFTLILRGLGVGDDYAHLPLVSSMAAGDFPPHYSLHPEIFLPYHYALDLFAATAVRIGGFFPWSAWDISRAFVLSLTLTCAWIWLRRITRSKVGAYLGSGLIAFGMGTRWLLALLPKAWIANISSDIQIIGSSAATGDTLAKALFRSWVIDGGPPVPIPFAFANGILNPLTYDWAGAASLPLLAMILILMIASRRALRPVGLLLLGVAILSLALSAEHIFVLLTVGGGLAAFINILHLQTPPRKILASFSGQFLFVALIAALLSFVQGGVITEFVRTRITGQAGVTAAGTSVFSLRWPPVFYDSHFGSLSITSWRQLIVLLAEGGPILFLFLIVIYRMRNDFRHHRTFEFGLGIASFLSVIIPLFVSYYVQRDITRFTGFGLDAWLLLSIQPLWNFVRRGLLWKKLVLGFGYAVTVFGGIALFALQATAIISPESSSFISSMDSRISQAYWNRLTPQTMVFDPIGFRGQTVFGRLSIAATNGFTMSQFVPYLAAPDPHALQKLGFGYIYIDLKYWERLSPEYQQALGSSCAKVIKRLERYNSATGELSDFRVLIDITNCK
ncbi:MAG: hypothetical protein M1282_17125 [Chloroflexi bacterium]|nr:hypothetical protein [Chloroflexota bacterium]